MWCGVIRTCSDGPGGVGQGSRATIFAESADWIPYICFVYRFWSLLLSWCEILWFWRFL